MNSTQLAFLIDMTEQKMNALSDYWEDEESRWQYELLSGAVADLRRQLKEALEKEAM